MLNASWAGAPAYAAAGWRIHASWGGNAMLPPVGIAPPTQQVGAPAISQQLIIAPAGWLDSTPPAVHFAGREDEYGAAQYTLNASWYGAAPYAPPVWSVNASWGAAAIIAPRAIQPPDGAVPAPFVTQPRRIGDAGGIAPPEVSEGHTVTASDEYVPAYGRLDASWYGAPAYQPPRWVIGASWGGAALIAPAGIAPAGVGTPALTPQQLIAPAGIAPAGGVGDGHSALHPWQYATPRWRLDASWAGAGEYTPPHWVLNASWTLPTGDSYIAPLGIESSAAVGTPALPVVQAQGWQDAAFGQHAIANGAAQILATSIRSQVAFGLHDVAHRQRWVTPEGIAPSTVWGRAEPPGLPPVVQWWNGTAISHFLRYVDVAGKGVDSARYGRPWVSHSPRVLDVDGQGIEPGFVGVPAMGGEQGIFPAGWLDERFGARIVPPEQILDVVGWRDLQWGEARVWNHTHYIRPQGYAPWRDAPHLRWGWGEVWNLRQFIVTDSSHEDTGLAPPESQVSARAVVKNRDRTLAPWGDLFTKFGYTHVWLKGQAIYPAGIEPPDDDLNGRPHRVSHWQQRVYPEPIEPKPIYRWHAVTNKADPLLPAGWESAAWGKPALANLNRSYALRGWDSAEVGAGGMVAFRVRHIVLDGSAPIVRPYNAGHSVHLGQRWLRPEGIYAFRDGFNGNFEKLGIPDVVQRFKRIRGACVGGKQADDFGEARVRNVTPELKPRGKVQTEWGEASIRTQWREVLAQGDAMTRWGKPRVADSRQWIQQTSKVNTPAIGWHTVKKVGIDPPSLQIIDLRRHSFNSETGEWQEEKYGHGIAPPLGDEQVPRPDLTKNKIWAEGWLDTRFGQAELWFGGVRVEPGIAHFPFGDATVEHKHRTIFPESIGQQVQDGTGAPAHMHGSFGFPRLSPHTIYAVLEAPEQAQRNHPLTGRWPLHAVNDGEKFGRATVGGYSGFIYPRGIPQGGDASSTPGASSYSPALCWGTPQVASKRHYIQPQGFRPTRFGWHSLPCDQSIIFDEEDYALPQESWGRAQVGFPEDFELRIRPRGWDSLVCGEDAAGKGTHEVQNLHRELPVRGWDSAQMGYSRPEARRYMPQSLHVGFPDWPAMQGWQDSRLGEASWVSHAIREVRPHGWEEFACTYTPEDFERRLRVRRAGDAPVTPQPQPGTVQEIRPQGWECGWRSGLPDVSNKAQRVKAGVICPPTNQVSIGVGVRHAA